MRAEVVAIDLGPNQSGLAALDRGFVTVRGQRYGNFDVNAWTLSNDQVRSVLRGARPKFVLIEEAPGGYLRVQSERALAQVRDCAERSAQTVCVANVSTWKTEAFGFHRVNKQRLMESTLFALERLVGPDDAAQVWHSTAGNANRNARSALILLMCWEPKEMVLARGRWGRPIIVGPHSKKAGPKRLEGLSKGARSLYETMWLTAEKGWRPGRALLCQAAGVSNKSYDRYVRELAELDLVECRRDCTVL